MRQRLWNSNLTGYFILGGLILFVLCFGVAPLYSQQLSIFFRSLEPSCTIEMGTATITVQAWTANDDCQAMLGDAHNFTGVYWAGIAFLASQPNMDGTIICEMDIAGRHLIVRDVGSSGAIACTMLSSAQNGQ